MFGDFEYAAQSWKRCRRVIVKPKHNFKGSNPRYVVTSLSGSPQYLYDKVYCARGEMENHTKEQQLYLFSDRTSSGCSYLESPMYFCRRYSGWGFATPGWPRRVACDTIGLRLLKIGAVIIENTRPIRFLLSCAYPWQGLFRQVVANLKAG